MRAKIIIVEDDPKQSKLVQRYLEREGHDVSIAPDGHAGIDLARRTLPDLMILDAMLPKVDGLSVCRILRAETDMPILMLTARSSEDDLLIGLELGADDYMTKPYSPRELMARVRTLLRRSKQPARTRTTIGDLVLDHDSHLLTLNGAVIDLTPAEFRLLDALAAYPGRTFSRTVLLEHLHSFDRSTTLRAVDSHVKNLRKKLELDPRRPRYIQTLHGIGYRVAADPQIEK